MTFNGERTCFIDGYELEGQGFRYPNRKKPNGKFAFDDIHFYGPGAALFYLTTVKQNSPHLITWLHLFVKRDLGIFDPIVMSPDPRLLAKNRWDGKGLTKEQFREYGNAHRLVEKINHLPIDLRVWVQEEQLNHDLPFHETIDGELTVAQMLLKEHQEQGKPIPKVLLPPELATAGQAAATTKMLLTTSGHSEVKNSSPEFVYGEIVSKSDDEDMSPSSPKPQVEEEEEKKTQHPEAPKRNLNKPSPLCPDLNEMAFPRKRARIT